MYNRLVMNRKNLSRWAICALGAMLLLGGCAQPRSVFRFALPENAVEKVLLWPPAEEVPRYRYVGDLTGEANFFPEGEETRRKGFLDWLAGMGADEPPSTVLQRPQSGVVDEQRRIYVTDTSRQAVFVFDEERGELLVWEIAEPSRKFVAPTGIALGADGQVLVADAELGVVARLDRSGKPLGSFGRGVLVRPAGLARDPERKLVYVADARAHDVKVFDDGGNLVKVIGRRGDGEGEFNFPTYLAFTHGELYVTDTLNNRIQVLDGNGKAVRKFGERGLYVGNLVRPKGVAVDDEGHIYVVESYYDHLLVFDQTGDLLLPIGGTGTDAGKFYLPAGVWVDRHNRVFVSDMFNGRVSVFQFLGGS